MPFQKKRVSILCTTICILFGATSSNAQEVENVRCGPDVTLQVLKTLDYVKGKYPLLTAAQKTQNCSIKGLTNFDIHRLIQYKSWVDAPEVNGGKCAPKGTSCQYTVEFFGRCYHAAVVNYTLWGVIDSLCDLIVPYHAIWDSVEYGGSPHYREQKIMVEFGNRYAKMRGTAEDYMKMVKKRGDNFLSGLRTTTHPGYGGQCSLPCKPATALPKGPWKHHWQNIAGGQ